MISAKHYNPEDEVALVTNLRYIPSEYVSLLTEKDVKVFNVDFDAFEFPADYKWSLAFYKLCALNAIIKMPYENVCYMDSDVYVQGNFKNVWKECEQNILMYDLSQGLEEVGYQHFNDEVDTFLGQKVYATRYGGEFFAARKELAIEFCEKCAEIYKKIITSDYIQNGGDEFIISVAALNLRHNIKNAELFIYRFWTGSSFRFISSVYKYNRVVVLHVPAEKERGMIKIYNRYIRRGSIPKEKTVWRLLRISHLSPWEFGKYILASWLKFVKQH